MANSKNDTRITQDLLPPGVLHDNITHPMTDIRRGGQFGWQPDMQAIGNATPATTQNLICKVLSSPRGFGDLPNSEIWHGAFKALFEVQALSFDGLNKTLNPSWGETAVGGSGEVIEVPTGMTRERSTPSFTFNDKVGFPITNLVEQYQRLFIQDENTKHPGISLINNDIPDALIDYYTWTMIFIEPDRYFNHATRAYLGTAMGIKNSPEQTGRRDLNQDHELVEFSLELSGVFDVGPAVDAVGTRILRSMQSSLTDPQRAPAFMDAPNADVADRDDVGFQEMLEKGNAEMISSQI